MRMVLWLLLVSVLSLGFAALVTRQEATDSTTLTLHSVSLELSATSIPPLSHDVVAAAVAVTVHGALPPVLEPCGDQNGCQLNLAVGGSGTFAAGAGASLGAQNFRPYEPAEGCGDERVRMRWRFPSQKEADIEFAARDEKTACRWKATLQLEPDPVVTFPTRESPLPQAAPDKPRMVSWKHRGAAGLVLRQSELANAGIFGSEGRTLASPVSLEGLSGELAKDQNVPLEWLRRWRARESDRIELGATLLRDLRVDDSGRVILALTKGLTCQTVRSPRCEVPWVNLIVAFFGALVSLMAVTGIRPLIDWLKKKPTTP